jgi:hypothetical protein
MKNIYLIPTDKPSRLIKNSNENTLNLCIQTLPLDEEIYCYPQNINITSDVEIKGFDWCYDKVLNIVFQTDNHTDFNYVNQTDNVFKIILTTDPQLIANGIQEIDDEFLQWYVKNPSCEYVEVNEKLIIIQDKPLVQHQGNKPIVVPHRINYKIIIPKEEPVNPNNQEVMFHEEHKEYFYEDFIDGKFVTVWLGKDYIPQEEPKQIKCYCGHTITCDCEPLQETLEEAAEKQWGNVHRTGVLGFIDGGNWQAERMHSEEDLKKAIDLARVFSKITENDGYDEFEYTPIEIIQQFKKEII